MGDDLLQGQAGLHHHDALVPGLEDLPAIDALDEETLEYHLGPVDAGAVRHDAEHGDAAAVDHLAEDIPEGSGGAGHFQADIETFEYAEAAHEVTGDFFLGDIYCDHPGGDAFRQFESVIVDVGDDDIACAAVGGDHRSHDADGAGAGDDHVFAHHVERQSGVHRVAVGIEAGQNLRGYGHVGTEHILSWDRQVLGEAASAVDADPDSVGTQMTAAGQAVAAAFADDVAFAGDDVADLEPGDIGAHVNDFTGEFVTDGHRHGDGFLCPLVPVIDVHVRATNCSLLNFFWYFLLYCFLNI